MSNSKPIIARALRGDHCECGACREPFNSTAAFDAHRAGRHGVSRRCLSTFEMLRAGMVKNRGGWWITRERPALRSDRDSRSGDRLLTLARVGGGT